MARLRLLLALLLMAVGTTLGAFAISGYYEPHTTHAQPAPVPSGVPQPLEKPQLAQLPPRYRFVAIDDGPAAALPAEPRTAAKTAPVKPKPAVKEQASVKHKRPQQEAAQWPWSLFSN